MKLRKWNYDKREYEPYEVPDSWSVKTYSGDMDEIVNCCQCGKEVPFGECYTSHEIHTKYGIGYAVCSKCYDDENIRYSKGDCNTCRFAGCSECDDCINGNQWVRMTREDEE